MKRILSTIITVLLLTACNETVQTNSTTATIEASSSTNENTANFTPTKKYKNIQTYYTDSNNFEFKIIKNNPLEFVLIPSIPPQSSKEIVIDEYKYAALDGLLLVFAKTDTNEIAFHIQAHKKPKISFKAKREDVLKALKHFSINSFDDLIEHNPNKGVIAGQSQSQAFLDLRKDNQKSWALINSFRIDNELIGK